MFLKESLTTEGHHVMLDFKSRKDIVRNMEKIVIADEMNRRKEMKLEPLLPIERLPFVTDWKKNNANVLMKQLVTANESPPLKFLNGIFLAPLFAKTTVPLLQKVFMTDTCHLHFGKYTLFCCYRVTANSNMSLVGFAVMFGNENTESWRMFWRFVMEVHPAINSTDVTIITDQDKGQINHRLPPNSGSIGPPTMQ
jgi:hypothetical protein